MAKKGEYPCRPEACPQMGANMLTPICGICGAKGAKFYRVRVMEDELMQVYLHPILTTGREVERYE